MNRRVQCVEQQESPSNITKYCPCPKIASSRFDREICPLLPPKGRRFEDIPRKIPAGSDHELATRTCLFAELTLISATSPNIALAKKSDIATSPTVCPPPKSCTPASLQLHQICSCRGKLHCNFTKYCACHEQQDSSIIATSPNMHLPRKVTLQLHQQCARLEKLHSSIVATSPNMLLPRKVTLQLHRTAGLQHHCNFTKYALATKSYIATSSNSAPATKSFIPTSLQLHQIPTMKNVIPCLIRITHETSRSMR